ncbi:MAG: hypothetical protein NXH82_04625 [Rhodobacteraceae bacterium]|nr:hypothetical protein [Paracoccaceae bacterium]
MIVRRVLVPTLLVAAAAAALTACQPQDDRLRFDGQVYRTKASKVGDDLSVFQVTASPVSASLAGAREAAAYEAIRYCISNYGTSAIEWSVGPDTDTGALIVEKDQLTFSGECRP